MIKIGEMNWKKYEYTEIKVGMFVLNDCGDVKFIGDLNECSGSCGCCCDYIEMYCDDYVELFNKNLDNVKEYWSKKLNDKNNP